MGRGHFPCFYAPDLCFWILNSWTGQPGPRRPPSAPHNAQCTYVQHALSRLLSAKPSGEGDKLKPTKCVCCKYGHGPRAIKTPRPCHGDSRSSALRKLGKRAAHRTQADVPASQPRVGRLLGYPFLATVCNLPSQVMG